MAIFCLSVIPLSRKAGRSATAAAAYRAAEKIHDQASGLTFDYTRKRGVEHAEIVLPTAAAKRDINWARDRQQLWNAAEAAENRSNSRTAREYRTALPHELNRQQRVELVQRFARDLADRYTVAVDFAIHAPHRHGDDRNFHMHLLSTTRTIEAGGLGEKSEIEWSDTDRRKAGLGRGKQEIELIRARWETITNEYLKDQGIEARIDRRSLKDQGIEREPQSHLGPSVSAMERRGIKTEVGKRLDAEALAAAQARLEKVAELGKLERERVAVERSILDLSGDLQAAKRERELMLLRQPSSPQKSLTVDEIRAQARADWLKFRAEQVAKEQAPAAEQAPSQTPSQTPAPERQKPLSLDEQRRESRERWAEYRREQLRKPAPEPARSVEPDRGQEQARERGLKPSKGLDGPEID